MDNFPMYFPSIFATETQNLGRFPGTMVAAEESDFGWAVVSRHEASEQDGSSVVPSVPWHIASGKLT